MMLFRQLLPQCVRRIAAVSGIRTITSKVLKEGDIIHNYEVNRIYSVPDLFLSSIELQHLTTKSKHLHLARDDGNNVFNVSLRTTPMDDTGVAHILEHIVLCGSKLFPVRDPFFKMLDRSMATFMNAMTGSDYTMYPFATQNKTDYRNLMSVYLDAVFFPLLSESSFLQEGWRLEHNDPADQQSPIIFKGVVFNEMKGVMADSDYLFGTNMQRNILPDHTYRVCSGGDPHAIPQLTWEGLKEFHRSHYHPSNANFFTYGNLDIREHLRQIDEQVMQKFSPINPDSNVPPQKRWTTPRSAKISCSPSEMAANSEKESSTAISFLLSDISDAYETCVLSILCSLLSDGPSSPFYKALIESGIGSSYAPSSGFHMHQKETVFSIGLQGVREVDDDKIHDIISKTVNSVIENGFTEERIEGILHQSELHQKHQSSQFGLHLSFNIMPMWQHGADPVSLLDVSKHISRLRQELEHDPKLFQKYVEKYFKNNPHHLKLTMAPDAQYKKKQNDIEKNLLHSKIEKLSQDDRLKLFQQGQHLVQLQNQTEDISCLPTLLVSDISRKQPETRKGDVFELDTNMNVVMFEQPTNGVNYLTLMKTVNALPEELKPFLPLFCSVLTQMGTTETNYQRMSELEELYTGGLTASVGVSPSLANIHDVESRIVFQSHCLEKNTERMFQLWSELLTKPCFENMERFQTIVRQNAQELVNSVSFSGHLYAMHSASRNLSPSAWQAETWQGLTQVKLMQSIAEGKNLDTIVSKMQEIAKYVLSSDLSVDNEKVRCALHCTTENRMKSEKSLINFISGVFEISNDRLMPINNENIFSPGKTVDFEHTINNFLHELPLPVNFVSLCLPTGVKYTHPDSAALQILSRIVSMKYLIREVREKGGAYGAGARLGNDGVFQFYSYRDPRSSDTIDCYNNSIKWACDGGFSLQDLDEAKLALFQKVDAPVSPCNRGQLYFTNGITDEMRQTHRENLLDATRESITSVAMKYLTLDNKSSAILGPKNEEIQTQANWKVVFNS